MLYTKKLLWHSQRHAIPECFVTFADKDLMLHRIPFKPSRLSRIGVIKRKEEYIMLSELQLPTYMMNKERNTNCILQFVEPNFKLFF